MTTRKIISADGPLVLAMNGVITVPKLLNSIPKPKVALPPYLSANMPPGIWVMTYPQKNEANIIPWVFSLQSNSIACNAQSIDFFFLLITHTKLVYNILYITIIYYIIHITLSQFNRRLKYILNLYGLIYKTQILIYCPYYIMRIQQLTITTVQNTNYFI